MVEPAVVLNFLFMPPRSKIGGHIVFVLSAILPFCNSVILSFCPPLWNFNLANNFGTVSARALIFYMNIPCDKTFLLVGTIYLYPLILDFDPFFWNFNLANKFWTVNARTLILYMNIPCDKTFLLVPLFFPCDLDLYNFFETLTLLINFELWVLELLYFTWVFLVIRPLQVFHI